MTWMAHFDGSTVAVGEVEVVRQRAKQSVLAKRGACSGYTTHVLVEQLFETRDAALKSIEQQVRHRVALLRSSADAIEERFNKLLENK